MTVKKPKLTLRTALKEWATPALIIGVVVFGYSEWNVKNEKDANYKQAKEQELKEITFDTPRQKVKMIDHLNTEFTPVNAFLKQKRLDSVYDFALEQFKLNKKKDSIDQMKELEKDKSRAKRDSINELILKNQEKLLSMLDTIN